MWIEGAEKLFKIQSQSFNHYCAKHHEWWNTSNAKDCPTCIKNEKRKCTKQVCFCDNNGVCKKMQKVF